MKKLVVVIFLSAIAACSTGPHTIYDRTADGKVLRRTNPRWCECHTNTAESPAKVYWQP